MFNDAELLIILVALGDSLRREEEHRPNDPWAGEINALRKKVREMLKAHHSVK